MLSLKINWKKFGFYIAAMFWFSLSMNPVGWAMAFVAYLGAMNQILVGYKKDMYEL